MRRFRLDSLARHAAIHREAQPEPLFPFVAASQPPKLLSVRLAIIDFQPSLVPHWPLQAQAQIGTAGNAEGASMPQPLIPARHAQEAVFERRPDPIADVIARIA
jgi:hypothetical protein